MVLCDYNAITVISDGGFMANITIRNLDEAIKVRLRLRAAQHGCSMEEEARMILRQSLMFASIDPKFAQRVQRRFADFGLDELQLPDRQLVRYPPVME